MPDFGVPLMGLVIHLRLEGGSPMFGDTHIPHPKPEPETPNNQPALNHRCLCKRRDLPYVVYTLSPKPQTLKPQPSPNAKHKLNLKPQPLKSLLTPIKASQPRAVRGAEPKRRTARTSRPKPRDLLFRVLEQG